MKALHLAAFSAASASCFAVVAFDNFGPPSDPWRSAEGWVVSASGLRHAMQFTSGATGMLDQITIALGYDSLKREMEISLHEDNGGQIGSLLKTLPILLTGPYYTPYIAPIATNDTVDPSLYPNLILQTGKKYWVSANSEPDGANAVWNWTPSLDKGSVGVSLNHGQTWSYYPDTQGAFRVTVDPTGVPAVPEPATIALAGLALAAAARRRKKA